MKNHLTPCFRLSLAALGISLLSMGAFAASTNDPAPSFSYWHKRLSTANSTDGVTVSVPKNAPDKISSTIVLKIQVTPEIN